MEDFNLFQGQFSFKAFKENCLKNIKCITKSSSSFPKGLLDLPDCPKKLFVLGNEEILNNNSISIVGTRNSSALGNRLASNLSKQLSSSGIVIVSGLAHGIDTSAHEATFNNGITIAVIACGFNNAFNSRNTVLIYNILKNGGAVISEYSSVTHAAKHTFLERNRIIAGLSKATVVIEAPFKSGALNTAKHALSLMRNLFVIPWSLDYSRGYGCNALIKNGATILTNYEQILDLFKINRLVSINNNSNLCIANIYSSLTNNNQIISKNHIPEDFKKLYNFISKNENVTKDLILAKFPNETISNINSKLTLMELQGFISYTRK